MIQARAPCAVLYPLEDASGREFSFVRINVPVELVGLVVYRVES